MHQVNSFLILRRRKEGKMMLHLKDVHRNVISDPNEMRKNALGFYMDLFGE